MMHEIIQKQKIMLCFCLYFSVCVHIHYVFDCVCVYVCIYVCVAFLYVCLCKEGEEENK